VEGCRSGLWGAAHFEPGQCGNRSYAFFSNESPAPLIRSFNVIVDRSPRGAAASFAAAPDLSLSSFHPCPGECGNQVRSWLRPAFLVGVSQLSFFIPFHAFHQDARPMPSNGGVTAGIEDRSACIRARRPAT